MAINFFWLASNVLNDYRAREKLEIERCNRLPVSTWLETLKSELVTLFTIFNIPCILFNYIFCYNNKLTETFIFVYAVMPGRKYIK